MFFRLHAVLNRTLIYARISADPKLSFYWSRLSKFTYLLTHRLLFPFSCRSNLNLRVLTSPGWELSDVYFLLQVVTRSASL